MLLILSGRMVVAGIILKFDFGGFFFSCKTGANLAENTIGQLIESWWFKLATSLLTGEPVYGLDEGVTLPFLGLRASRATTRLCRWFPRTRNHVFLHTNQDYRILEYKRIIIEANSHSRIRVLSLNDNYYQAQPKLGWFKLYFHFSPTHPQPSK